MVKILKKQTDIIYCFLLMSSEYNTKTLIGWNKQLQFSIDLFTNFGSNWIFFRALSFSNNNCVLSEFFIFRMIFYNVRIRDSSPKSENGPVNHLLSVKKLRQWLFPVDFVISVILRFISLEIFHVTIMDHLKCRRERWTRNIADRWKWWTAKGTCLAKRNIHVV